jgi:hypothetical protein
VLPVDNPDEIQISPSGPELIDIDEIARLDDPEFTTPRARSTTCVSAQLEIVGVSMETSASDPLLELIKIYDDDESPKVSLGTLCISKKKRDLRRHLLLFPRSKPRRSHRKKMNPRVS